MADKNHAGYPSNSVTLVTNQIIKMLCFDATEPSNGNSDRRNYGNNRYIYSNLRQWLNSPAAAGQWYTAQHSADQTPDSSHVWNSVNPYSGLAGFLNAFTANERAALLNTTITVGKSSTDGGGTETCTDKIFPLSCTEVGLSGDHVCGSKLAIFSDNNSRIATVTASCVANSNYSSNPGSGAAWYYWLRDAYAGSADYARRVIADGTLSWDGAYGGYNGLRPACNLSSDLLISDSVDSDGCYTVIYNQAPTAPSSITVPSEVLGGENLSISWAASTDPDGNLSGYVLERKVGSGTWAQVYKGSTRTYTDTITYGWTSVQYRVKAYDAAGAESAYTTSATRTVTNNRPPVISGTDGALGSFSTAAPSYEYTVTDADGHQVDVVEMLDGVTLRSYTVTLGQTNTLTIGSEAWLKVVNGSHTPEDRGDRRQGRQRHPHADLHQGRHVRRVRADPRYGGRRHADQGPRQHSGQFPGRLHASGLDLQQRQRREPDVGGHHAEGPHRPEALLHKQDQDGRSVGRQSQGQAAPRLCYGDLLHPVDRR